MAGYYIKPWLLESLLKLKKILNFDAPNLLDQYPFGLAKDCRKMEKYGCG
jgi:hypothetical protein